MSRFRGFVLFASLCLLGSMEHAAVCACVKVVGG